jgi:hypothetical protein
MKGSGEQRQETWDPVVYKGRVMHQIEADLTMQSPADEIGADLPQIVIPDTLSCYGESRDPSGHRFRVDSL